MADFLTHLLHAAAIVAAAFLVPALPAIVDDVRGWADTKEPPVKTDDTFAANCRTHARPEPRQPRPGKAVER